MAQKSPFPGMDPYLEQHWGDVHGRLILYSCDAIQSQLPGDLLARTEERVFVQSDETVRRVIYPDVRVLEQPAPDSGTAVAVAEADVAVAEPMIIEIDEDPVTETFIEIREAGSGNRVISVIEILSPSNKAPGKGQKLYRKKQQKLKRSKVNFVEIDLLREGDHVLSVPEWRIPPKKMQYQVCVRRWRKRSRFEYYPVSLQNRLPIVRIPLRKTDEDVTLDLQKVIDEAYQKGRYDRMDYRSDPVPALDKKDAAWAEEILSAAGKR